MNKGCILHFSYLTNLSCLVINMNTTGYLGQDFSSGSAVGLCGAPEASVAPARSVRCCGRASGRDLVGTLSLRAHLCQPECCPGKLCCCWASADGGQACAKARVRFKWQKSFLLCSHRLCSAKLDDIKLIKPEIRSCSYYLIIKLQR